MQIEQGYKRIIAWQKAVQLTTVIYKITDQFPQKELYGLSSQMRRASISIASNIAEGYRRKTTKDYENFVRIAYGSASELETQLIIAEQIGYLNKQMMSSVETILIDVLKLLNNLSFSLRKKMSSTPTTQHPDNSTTLT
jgi:four helix bundle protein